MRTHADHTDNIDSTPAEDAGVVEFDLAAGDTVVVGDRAVTVVEIDEEAVHVRIDPVPSPAEAVTHRRSAARLTTLAR